MKGALVMTTSIICWSIIGPTPRKDSMYMKPIIDRVFGIMLRKQMFGPVPEALRKKDLEITYVSQISKAQRASEADTFTRVIQSIAPIIEAQPQVFDNLNGDEILRYHAKIFGLPEEMLRSPDAVEEARGARAQQEVDMAQAQQDNIMADTQQKLANSQQG